MNEVQIFPYPVELAELVHALRYRPGWTFSLQQIDRGQGSKGLTLDVVTSGFNSYKPEGPANYRVHHYFPVPPAAYNERSWRHWLFEQLLLVERHEAMEFFRFEYDDDNVLTDYHPYAPNHGPGNDPYIVSELSTDEERRTNFKGQVKW